MQAGDPVKIVAGRLKGAHGTFVRLKGLRMCVVVVSGNEKPQDFRRSSAQALVVAKPLPPTPVERPGQAGDNTLLDVINEVALLRSQLLKIENDLRKLALNNLN